MNTAEEEGTANPRGPPLMPKIVWPDGSAANDSSFLIQQLEGEYPHTRRTVPSYIHKGLGLLSSLVEDFADEFVTKCMFHYRWVHDAHYAGRGLALQGVPSLWAGEETLIAKVGALMQERQVERLSVVGSNLITGRVIETFYSQLLQTLEAHFAAGYPFLFGSRPSAADFSLLGQLHPMIALDPNTSHHTRAIAPRVCAWYTYVLVVQRPLLCFRDSAKSRLRRHAI
jgi:glutathione S-transferase